MVLVLTLSPEFNRPRRYFRNDLKRNEFESDEPDDNEEAVEVAGCPGKTTGEAAEEDWRRRGDAAGIKADDAVVRDAVEEDPIGGAFALVFFCNCFQNSRNSE